VEYGPNGNPAALRPSSPVQDALGHGAPDLSRLGSVGDVHSIAEVGGDAGANCLASLDTERTRIRFRCCDIGADLNERPLASGPEALRRLP
jgi:hypothetical protein